MDLNLARLQLPLSASTALALQQLLQGSCSSFEAALLRTSCPTSAYNCRSCHHRTDCQAYTLLARSLSPDPELVRRYQKPALPFVFAPSPTSEPVLRLTLAGPACDALPLFADTLAAMTGEQVRFGLHAFDYQEQLKPLQFQADGQCDNLPLLSLAELYEQYRSSFVGCRSVELAFQTPLRLRHNGHELQYLQPAVLIRSLLRRLSSLAAYYGAAGDSDQISILAGRADAVQLQRKTDHGEMKSNRRGICGRYQLNGPFEEFGPYLALGSLVHLGKGAAYGQGIFTVARLD